MTKNIVYYSSFAFLILIIGVAGIYLNTAPTPPVQLLSLIAIGAICLAAYSFMRSRTIVREQLLKLHSETAATYQGMAVRMTRIVEMQQDIIYQRLNLQNAMEVITLHTQAITEADGAVVEMYEDGEMVYRAASGTMAPYVGLRLKAQASLSGLCVELAAALCCEDTEKDDRVEREACRNVGVRSMIVVPLIHKGETVGVLKVASGHVRFFTPEDLATLQLMVGVLSATLRDALDSAALQDSYNSLSMVNATLQSQKAQLESDKVLLKDRADTDGMTGLHNYRYFHEKLLLEHMHATRWGGALSVILIDVDHFKPFNDSFGHPAGDAALKQVARLLKLSVRPGDCVARYGGEEFVILLPESTLADTANTAERIRQVIQDSVWEHRPVTVSMGISGLENGGESALSMIEQADKALYQSKKQGRNQVTVFQKVCEAVK